jgi:signal transduction histidine kinase
MRDSKCTVVFTHSAPQLELLGSPARLAQVVTNLVGNAADASKSRGGGEIRVTLAPADDGYLLLEVSDSGGGIPPDILTKIFEPMFTTKPFGEGTGLGLSIVHDVVTGDFKGSVEVRSKVGKGTTFSLKLAIQSAAKVVPDGA